MMCAVLFWARLLGRRLTRSCSRLALSLLAALLAVAFCALFSRIALELLEGLKKALNSHPFPRASMLRKRATCPRARAPAGNLKRCHAQPARRENVPCRFVSRLRCERVV